MLYTDIENNEIVTEKQLYSEYMEKKTEDPEEFDYSFAEYIRNCLTRYNGTLEPIQ